MAKEPNPRIVTKKHLARLERERIQRRYLLIGTAVVVVLVLAIVLYGVLDQAVFRGLRPVAKVGAETITTNAFEKQVRYTRSRMVDELIQYTSDPLYIQFMGSYLQQLMQQLTPPENLGQEVIDSMVEDQLVAMEAQERGITVTEEELNKAFEEAFGFFENGTPTPEPTSTPLAFSTSTLSPLQMTLVPPTATPEPTAEATAEATAAAPDAEATPTTAATPEAEVTPTSDATATPAATATITPTATPYTREGFRGQVNQFVNSIEDTGYNEADLREMIRKQLLKRKVYEAITEDVAVEGEQFWARHILVATEEEAKAVIDRLNQGESFAELAQELSTDTGSAVNGGDLGWSGPGAMVAPFEEAANNLEIGEVSQPVQTQFGYHVIQLLGREVRPLSADQLESAKSKAYQDWLAQAKEETEVVVYDDYWKSIVPAEPEVPAQVQNAILQSMQPQQQPAIPDDSLFLPTEPAAE